MIEILHNNPFRILGVYANASAKEITSNKSKLAAYANVGKVAAFPLDNAVEGVMPRSEADIANAQQALQLPEDKIKYALFWFAKGTADINIMACDYLEAGNREKAKELFQKQRSLASLLDLSTMALCEGDYATAVSNMMCLLHNDNYRKTLTTHLVGELFAKDEHWMVQMYIDVLRQQCPKENWLTIFSECGGEEFELNYIRQITTDAPIKKIEGEVAKAKGINKDDALANLKAGRELMNNTKAALAELQSLLAPTDVAYQMVVDKLALTILQCGINYFNNIGEQDDNSDVTNAMQLQNYALKIAVGTTAKGRCQENCKILDRIKKQRESLGPLQKDILSLIGILNKNRTGIEGARALVNEAKPLLEKMKQKMGVSNEEYLKLSTAVANNALGMLIEEVNNIQESSEIYELKEPLDAAMQVMRNIGALDMTPSELSRFFTNKRALEKMIDDLNAVIDRLLGNPTAPYSQRMTTYDRSDKNPVIEFLGENVGCFVLIIIGLIIFLINRCS